MSEQIIDNGTTWTSAGGDLFVTVNDCGDTIRALRSDLTGDEESER